MSNTLGQFNQSSPEGIITAPKGAKFFRNGDRFFLTVEGTTQEIFLPKKSFLLAYQNESWFPTLKEETITFINPSETWLKTGAGNNKSGWKLLGSLSSIARASRLPIFGNTIGAWAGYYQSYVLNTENELWSMGYNDDGQLGIGYNNYRESASLSLTNVKLAAASCEGYFAGAVKNDNTLWFTGYGGDGTFGNGTNDSYSEWTETVLEGDITGSGTITNLVTGEYYSALLMSDGTVWASSVETFSINSNTFIQIASNVKSISGGGYHLLYVKNDDTLWGIGDNWNLQLGNEISPWFNWDEPYQIASGVASCAAMGYHSAYIDTDDNLYTFGANWSGQLGTPLGYDDFDVATPQLIDTNVKFVNGGDSFTFYIKNDGTLYGCGYADDGALGDGQWYDVITPKIIDTNVSYAVGGNEHSLYIKTNKELYGMGWNWYFQLGGLVYPTTLYYSDATGWTKEGVTQFTFVDDSSVDEIYWRDAIYGGGKFIAGGGEGIAQIRYSTDGKIWQTGSIQDFGGDISGVAYNGTNKYVAVSSVSDYYNDGRPETYTSTDGINWVTGSYTNTNNDGLYGLDYLNGKFIAGGENRIVTSSNGEDWSEQTPAFNAFTHKFAYGAGKYVAAVGWGDWNDSDRNVFNQSFDSRSADFVSLGDGHATILKDGTLYGCGYNGDGQLGIGSDIDMVGFVPVTSNVRNVAAGQYFTSFVKNDSTLWAMGANYNYQLGDGTSVERRSPVQIDTNVSQSFASSNGNNNMFYVKNDGTLWGVGENTNGQLGGGFEGYTTESIQIDTDVVQASVGADHVIYIKNDGTLWGRGYNWYGQLGLGNNDNTTSSLQITSSVAYCSAGANNSFFITTGGDLYAMGWNGYGQLGLGDSSDRNTPTFVTSSVAQVYATNIYTSFVTTGGEMYSMGYNGYGQFGNGTYDNSNVPAFGTASVDMLSSGDGFTYIIANDGNVYSAGSDNQGRLGTYMKVYKGMYSSDASTWYSSSMTDVWYNDIAYGNGRFVATGDEYNIIASSTDGMNWTSSIISTSSYVGSNRVVFDGTKFVSIGYYGENYQNIYTSTNGVNWTISSTGDGQYWGALAYGDGKYVALTDGWRSYVNPKYKLTIG